MKEKRPRVTRSVPAQDQRSQDERDSEPRNSETSDYPDKRKSFNPNFTRDNKPVHSGNRSYDRPSGERRWNNDNRSSDTRKPWNSNNNSGDSGRRWNSDNNSGDLPRRWNNDNNSNDRYNRSNSGGYNNNRPNRYGQDDRENRPNRYSSDNRGNREYRGNRENNDNREYRGNSQNRGNNYSRDNREFRPRQGGGSNYNNTRRPNNGPKRSPYRQYDKDNYPRFDAPKQEGAVRLNRFIANSGVCSRREADELIVAGAITVNGKVITELGSKVQPGDEVRYNGEIIKGEKKVYILMNKPKGYVTSLDDPHADKTVMDLLRNACKERIYPIGRLDKNSMGVLLVTNDGELTRLLTHPTYNKKKIYQVSLNKPVTQEDMQKLADGVELEDGLMYADEISYVGDTRKEVGIEIHSGRNRIVRRLFEALGYSVQKLDRVYFAGLTKKMLKRGAWRFLSPMEVSRLKSGEYQ